MKPDMEYSNLIDEIEALLKTILEIDENHNPNYWDMLHYHIGDVFASFLPIRTNM